MSSSNIFQWKNDCDLPWLYKIKMWTTIPLVYPLNLEMHSQKPKTHRTGKYFLSYVLGVFLNLSFPSTKICHNRQREKIITSALPYVNNLPHLENVIGCVLSFGCVF
jgi:hypothetical protein